MSSMASDGYPVCRPLNTGTPPAGSAPAPGTPTGLDSHTTTLDLTVALTGAERGESHFQSRTPLQAARGNRRSGAAFSRREAGVRVQRVVEPLDNERVRQRPARLAGGAGRRLQPLVRPRPKRRCGWERWRMKTDSGPSGKWRPWIVVYRLPGNPAVPQLDD